MHPLSTTLSGTQTINTAGIETGYGVPTAAATIVTQLDAARPTEFAYRDGAAMVTGNAPACRLFFSANNTTRFNAVAWTLFNRAATYTSMECGKNMLWTAAGNGATTYGVGDGRQSVTVGLNMPWGLAIDSQDRVYVADAGLHAVRRINTDGTVTTVAGTGTAGFSGDGGAATSARLNTPVRLAFDAAGNLFIADSANNRIRRVTPAGIISTVAGNGTAGNTGDGGQATSARLRTPYDVTIAPNGTMYIADRANHKVRRVLPSGIISTYAGTGTAGYTGDEIAATSSRLNTPYSVDVDAEGNLYIADYDNERVRMVDTGGRITTVAGTGIPTADGDGGLATEAGLHKPQYVQVTPGGDLFISESNSNRVRRVHDGFIDTTAGSGQFGYVGDGTFPLFSTWQRPSATALDSQGNLWIADRNNRRIRVISGS
jgi:sugar lactone lactonase YvrE